MYIHITHVYTYAAIKSESVNIVLFYGVSGQSKFKTAPAISQSFDAIGS